MVYLYKQGATSFYWLSYISLQFGLIDENTFYERMKCLSRMVYPDERNSHKLSFISPEDLTKEENEADIEESHEKEQEFSFGDGLYGCFPTKPKGNSWLYFLAKGLLKNWYFHKYDEDPNPSIPHAHFNKKSYPKLDPYTGWKYEAHGHRGNRVSKNATVELWNDSKFRRFAFEAIGWYMSEYPNYTWRVDNPLRLPRKK